jgi:hypothetical protein
MLAEVPRVETVVRSAGCPQSGLRVTLDSGPQPAILFIQPSTRSLTLFFALAALQAGFAAALATRKSTASR